MAGAGYKLFNTGDVLTAQQVNEYLQQQTVMVFANSTARTTALSGVLAEGMMSYLQDTNSVEVYNGSAWVAVGSSPLTTKGDLYTYSTTNARLASSAVNGDVLTVDTSTATGLKWAAPSSGSITLISTTTLSGATTTLSSIPQTYENLYLIVSGMTANTGNNDFRLMPNNVSNLANYTGTVDSSVTGTADQRINLSIFQNTLRTNADNLWVINFYNYTSTGKFKAFDTTGYFVNSSTQNKVVEWGGVFRSTSAISSLVFDYGGTNTFAGGTVLLYGVK